MNTDLNSISESITALNQLRKEERQTALNNIAVNLYNWCKAHEQQVLSAEFFNSLFADSIEARSKQRISKDIKQILLNAGKIEKSFIKRGYKKFQLKELKTQDYDSYATLLKANGYKKKYFFFTGIIRHTIKPEVIKTLNATATTEEALREALSELYNAEIYSEVKSSKSQDLQGCYALNNLSVKKSTDYKIITAYHII